jgi:hypothetical protein
MGNKIALICIMIGMAPFLFWASKYATYFLLQKFFGYNFTYDANVEGTIQKKRIRLTKSTTYEELVAISKEMRR